jgi:hypothetical protein
MLQLQQQRRLTQRLRLPVGLVQELLGLLLLWPPAQSSGVRLL